MNNETIVFTGNDIERFQVRAFRSALKLEILGMTRRGRSVYSTIKDRFGFTGNKKKVLEQLNTYIKENNI
jgi:hypothetical protein